MNGCDCGRYVDGRRIPCVKHPARCAFTFARDGSGNLRVADFDSSAVAFPVSPFVARALAGTLPAKRIR